MTEKLPPPPPGFVLSRGLFIPEKMVKPVFEKRVAGFAPAAADSEPTEARRGRDRKTKRMVAWGI